MAVASLPAAVISWATVVIVEDEELGSGGNVAPGLEGSVIVFAATTTSGYQFLVYRCSFLRRTIVTVVGNVDGDLTTDASRGADDESYRLGRSHCL